MSRILSILFGPELLWLLLHIVCGWLKTRNLPPSPAGNLLLERSCTLGMFLATSLTFVVFAVPGSNRWVLLVRVLVVAVIGMNVCLFRLIGGIDYGDSRNSGVLGFWVYGCMTGGAALLLGLVITVILLRLLAAKAN